MNTDLFPSEDDGQTPLTESELLDLKLHIGTRMQLNRAEEENVTKGIRWARRRAARAESVLNDGDCRELHRRMFAEVWRWAGKYRRSERNLGWEPHRITEGVRIALDDASYWFEHSTYSPTEAAVRLHHRLVVIHPWVNGNGRHARHFADMLLMHRGLEPLTWGAGVNLAAPGSARGKYLSALRAADAGDFALLVAFANS